MDIASKAPFLSKISPLLLAFLISLTIFSFAFKGLEVSINLIFTIIKDTKNITATAIILCLHLSIIDFSNPSTLILLSTSNKFYLKHTKIIRAVFLKKQVYLRYLL